MPPPPPIPIKRLLVANRGEIAVRILQAARELPHSAETFALYTEEDETHIHLGNPHHALRLPSPGSYVDIPLLLKLVKEHSIDAIHPGYGFLSESSDFARRAGEEARARVIGPGADILEKTGDKLQAKQFAEACDVPILPAIEVGDPDLQIGRQFASSIGYPVMVKAVDGGGGRGIRLARKEDELGKAVERAITESPSRKVFVEKAAVDGFHHIEVQVLGDGYGEVRHLWERDCSIQRRFQKMIECAPALIKNRALIAKVIEAALKMAKEIKYYSLGTFEFLVNESTSEFFFLEVNPRIQVEHTITEQIASFDLVRAQLLLAQGYGFSDIGLAKLADPLTAPKACSIQLRLCAEDPGNNFALSIGKITEFSIPGGNGVRVDTHCSQSYKTVVGSDFDNLIAKIIVTDNTWHGAVLKARRVLQDTRVAGIKTNLELLYGIIDNEAFRSHQIDTQWLDANLDYLTKTGQASLSAAKPALSDRSSLSSTSSQPVSASSSVLFRKGDAWTINLSPVNGNSNSENASHHLLLDRVLRNDFPNAITAELAYTIPGSNGPSTKQYRLEATSTQSSAASVSSTHRRGDPNNKRHIVFPMSGKLIEILIAEGDLIQQDEPIAFVKQMKMELEVRSPRAGRVSWALEIEDESGEDIAEGVLLAELEDLPQKGGMRSELRGKL
ncbi:MAG: hypothetical protein M1820_003059 [Bogoriella megaspora]|nr:MAG: hypothetical protein M1820_003059 [Bogoriella megaspora]